MLKRYHFSNKGFLYLVTDQRVRSHLSNFISDSDRSNLTDSLPTELFSFFSLPIKRKAVINQVSVHKTLLSLLYIQFFTDTISIKLLLDMYFL